MTIANDIQCDACGVVYHLKTQVDQTIEHMDWSITVECAECGNKMEFRLSKKDGFSKLVNGRWQPVGERDTEKLRMSSGYLFGYSQTLPIVPSGFHKKVPMGIGPFSPYIQFTMESGISQEKIAECNQKNAWITANIIPDKDLIPSLFSLLSHKPFNGVAFISKCVNVLEIKKEVMEVPTDFEYCLDFFDEFIQTVYKNLVTGGHPSVSQNNFYHQAYKWLVCQEPEALKTDFEDMKNLFSLDEYLMNVYGQISSTLKILDKLMQGIFRSEMQSLGVSSISVRMHITTIGHKELLNVYKEHYEMISKGLIFIAALRNKLEGRSAEDFGDGNPSNNFKRFASLSNGKRIELMNQTASFSDFFTDVLNAHWRNANEHADVEYDSVTQLCKFRYDSTQSEKFEEVLLIDIAKAVYRQLVFLIEISKLIKVAKSKTI